MIKQHIREPIKLELLAVKEHKKEPIQKGSPSFGRGCITTCNGDQANACLGHLTTFKVDLEKQITTIIYQYREDVDSVQTWMQGSISNGFLQSKVLIASRSFRQNSRLLSILYFIQIMQFFYMQFKQQLTKRLL